MEKNQESVAFIRQANKKARRVHMEKPKGRRFQEVVPAMNYGLLSNHMEKCIPHKIAHNEVVSEKFQLFSGI